MTPTNSDTQKTPAEAHEARCAGAHGSALISEREHDLMVALRQLCEATEKQCAANEDKESVLVRWKRNNAKKMLAKYEPIYLPNTQAHPRDHG